MRMTYLKNGETLRYDPALCRGCGRCVEVCPHAVFAMADGKSSVIERAACMECGACARNCRFGALSVKPGVGCAAAIIGGLLSGRDPSCGAECGCSRDPAGVTPIPMAADGRKSKGCCG
jgi:NAD-dependent dihydropyrimidine dehydrogenase PreA subunit